LRKPQREGGGDEVGEVAAIVTACRISIYGKRWREIAKRN
jgi:hypothetical protein